MHAHTWKDKHIAFPAPRLQLWREEERPVWWPPGMAYAMQKGTRKDALQAMWHVIQAQQLAGSSSRAAGL